MKHLLISVLSAAFLCTAQSALAAGEYNDVPSGDSQYMNCKIYAMKKWEGGGELSPIPGQSKAEAFCTCLWNETPDNFRGGLAKFSESEKGARINRICEKYSNWGD
jgi:hypothetical protein